MAAAHTDTHTNGSTKATLVTTSDSRRNTNACTSSKRVTRTHNVTNVADEVHVSFASVSERIQWCVNRGITKWYSDV